MSTGHITMGRQSKATLTRLNNFSKPINPQNPTVEEVFDDENTHFEDEKQKSHLEEFITSWGHICDFYPKYHCGLNFIEQYWGAAKLIYRSTPKTKDMKEMEENVKISLDDVPIVQIQWWASFSSDLDMPLIILSPISYANCAARFISAYGQGLSGPGKPKISWPSDIASRDGYKAKKRAW